MYSSSPLCAAISPSTFLNENCWGIPSGPGPAYSSTLVTWRSPTKQALWCTRVSSPIRKDCASVRFSVCSKENGRAMGLTISNLFARLFSKKQMRILMGELLFSVFFNSVRLTFDHRCIKHESCLLYNLSGEAVGGSPSFCVQVDMSHGIHHVET